MRITCRFILRSETNDDGGLDQPHYWLMSAHRAWKRPAPFRFLDRAFALADMPSSVRLFFEPLEPAEIQGEDFWALRLGVTEMDEDELNREWISEVVPRVIFREPVHEGDDCVPGLDVPDVTIN